MENNSKGDYPLPQTDPYSEEGYKKYPFYKVVYLRADCGACTSDVPKEKVEKTCNEYSSLGYELKEAYLDETCDPCCDNTKTVVLIFIKEPVE